MYNLILILILGNYDITLVKFNSNTLDHLNINNTRYRESTLLPNQDGYFAFSKKISKSDLSTANIDIFYHTGLVVPSKNNYLRDIIIKKNTLLEEVVYYQDTNHLLNIVSLVSFIGSHNSKIEVYILLGYKVISKKIITEKDNFSTYNKILLEPGKYNIEVRASSTDVVCSCPSHKDGYTNSRYLLAWVEKVTNYPIQLAKYRPRLSSIRSRMMTR